jgi:hypothetical protein
MAEATEAAAGPRRTQAQRSLPDPRPDELRFGQRTQDQHSADPLSVRAVRWAARVLLYLDPGLRAPRSTRQQVSFRLECLTSLRPAAPVGHSQRSVGPVLREQEPHWREHPEALAGSAPLSQPV